jgi:murein L,D-transpeptidase YafK
MGRTSVAFALRRARPLAAAGLLACAAGGCARMDVAPHLQPLSQDAVMLLGKKKMEVQAPIFIRIYKEESELEVWKVRDDRFYHYKTYPICAWSGQLGPKLRQGDRQAPEGFYAITRDQMRPDSQLHLAFNLGFPNAYDKAHRRTGDALMVHGGCTSSGCYAMTDALMEEIYALAREAFIGGQDAIHVHAFPFRMTQANMARHAKSQWASFWKTLKEGHDYFELTRQLPTIAICNRRYVVNVNLTPADAAKLNPTAACPVFRRPAPSPFQPQPDEQVADAGAAAPLDPNARSGLTSAPESPLRTWWRRLLPPLVAGGAPRP